MKVIKQDESRLLLRELNFLPIVVAVLIGGAGVFLAGIWLYIIYGLGVKSIACNRVELNVVNCTLKSSHFFGTISGKPKTLSQIKQAVLNTETSTDADGDVSYNYSMALQAADLVVNIDTGFGYIGSWRAKDFSEKINAFLASHQQNLVLSIDTRLDFENYLAILLNSLFAFALIYGGLIVIDFSNFITVWNFDRSKETAYYRQARLLDFLRKREKKKSYSLHKIAGIEIHNSQDLEDSESSPSYSIALVMGESEGISRNVKLTKHGTSELETQQNIAFVLGEFLGLVVPPEPISTSQINFIFEGKKSKYTHFGSFAELAEEQLFQPVLQLGKSIEALGFQPLDLLNVELFSGIRIAGYVHVAGNSYGLIMFRVEMGSSSRNQAGKLKVRILGQHFFSRNQAGRIEIKILGQEFYSVFSSNASLTTSTTPNVSDLPEKKIFRNSFPGVSLDELYKLHQQRMAELSIQQGEPKPVKPDLKSLAMAIDEYLVREARA